MMVVCPHCGTRVMPTQNGRCPTCRQDLSAESEVKGPNPPSAPARETGDFAHRTTAPQAPPPIPAQKARAATKTKNRFGLGAAILGAVLFEILVPYDAAKSGFSFTRVLDAGLVGGACGLVGTMIGSIFLRARR